MISTAALRMPVSNNIPSEDTTHVWLETHPHAAFCALLGQLPLPKPTLEGRLQRQIVLYEQGMGIKDPMGFFEEITRHKLVAGHPSDGIHLCFRRIGYPRRCICGLLRLLPSAKHEDDRR